ncbi:MAG: hypothetical protein HYS26_01775 [Candidatus Kaiserbacteria bacterium]|nr:MAG: hypothetical protein HYS26_01775 [Candidatus Kaiserbacteria bacterium]
MKNALLYISVALLVGLGIYAFAIRGQESAAPASVQSNVLAEGTWETKTNNEASVTVAVTPLSLGGSASEWRFKVVLDTHTGSLDRDLLETTTLSDGSGATYRASRWEGDPPGGHHREGELTFERIDPTPSRITIRINDLGGVPERTLSWDIQK